MPSDRTCGAVTLAVALALAAMLLAGCGTSASFESNDYYAGWLSSQPTGKQITNSAGRTGDKDVDGILVAADAIAEIEKADALQSDALAELDGGNLGRAEQLLDEAIELRPDDARYRRDRAIAAVRQGDAITATEQWAEQDRIAALNGHDTRPAYWEAAIREAVAEEMQAYEMPGGPDRDLALYATYTRLSELNQQAAEVRSSMDMSTDVDQHLLKVQSYDKLAESLADGIEEGDRYWQRP